VSGFGQFEVTDRTEEFVRNLRENPGTVTRFRIRSLGAPVLEIGKHGEGLGYRSVPAPAGEISDQPDAAGVVFV
jgi:hypothetical protein